MKRCPQCDFIYDDDQELCDMDGRELERVPIVSPGPPVAAPRPPRTRAGARRRRFSPLLISGITLGALLSFGYYLNTSRQAAAGHAVHAPPVADTAANPRPETVPATETPSPIAIPESPPSAHKPTRESAIRTKQRSAAVPTGRRTGAAAPAERPATKPSPRPAVERETKAQGRQNTNGKKESKLGAALRKTGRLLKKPFGF